ncbi:MULTISPECIES: nuclease-related domain-containing protein [Aerococcus]|uniref:NERD domain-containing protein n=1 Tax=Aerococcus sanguinicola TaxID=119206 RepID=A0A5N1GI75_9LACT|nr:MULTISPECIES: nuclease-related domain-containing protein [Aerococcus]KAA9300623.1 NERD domain-containing protein [Aerococcus sanguinicola]MDK6369574.1 nuclease-related domain-containing protein [Aerococcus sp. UMB9870]MDK6680079.1 nuclease-related domain-containing protein [Aerococcus sp. UMB8608]MDK6686240.1 nuclease-related domain-containing protein [Aerococcus sp. UMB8623]MDK6940159.1 nuclease-related domain-containing protein [Aerococcus sp. UMB8487]
MTRKESLTLQYFRTLKKYQQLTPEGHKKLDHFERGFEGELAFDHMLEQIDVHPLAHYRNWQYQDAYIEIDSLLVFPSTLCLIEVKNYRAQVSCRDRRWSFNNYPGERDICQQLLKSQLFLENLLAEHQFSINLEAKIYFANPYNYPDLDDSVTKNVLLPHQTKDFFQSLSQEKFNPEINSLCRLLEEIQSQSCLKEEIALKKFNPGFHCKDCGDQVQIFHYYMICSCGRKISKDEAIIELINDYALLFPSCTLNAFAIYCFACKEVGYHKIEEILQHNFIYIKGKNPREFLNPYKSK